ncbi:MAG: hypothetical protein RQ783_04680 [Gammaproteobacteria bacterium]|nr:hypothetical protein [Gammaproteobacteria bacterium]
MNLMFSCKDVHERASRYLNEDIDLFPRMGMMTHLLMCGHCRMFVKQLDLTVTTLGKIKTIDSAPDLSALAKKLQQKHSDK